MIETITKAELIASIAHLPDDAELVVGADYGDRVNTVQAIGLEMQPKAAYVVESDYSGTGYKLVGRARAEEELEEETEFNKVFVLNSSSIDDLDDDEDE